jgi:hypothetical protein
VADVLPPRPSDFTKTTVAASVTLMEAKQLRALAAARQVSVTRLVRAALTQVYGIPDSRDETELFPVHRKR